MVDFNSQTTIATPLHNINPIIVVEAQYNARLAIEDYVTKRTSGTQPNLSTMQARVWTYYNILLPALLRKNKKKTSMIASLEETNNDLRNTDMDADAIIDVFDRLNAELDAWQLTRIATRENIDTTIWEESNNAKGL